jgi:hypothetical protein
VNELRASLWVIVPFSLPTQYPSCRRCGRPVSSVSNYCEFCWTLLRPEFVLKICPNCKNRIPVSVRFWSQCGQKQQALPWKSVSRFDGVVAGTNTQMGSSPLLPTSSLHATLQFSLFWWFLSEPYNRLLGMWYCCLQLAKAPSCYFVNHGSAKWLLKGTQIY